MKQVNTHEAKSQLSKLIAAARAGEEVVICQAGKPVARLMPYEPPRKKPKLGTGKGKIILHPGWDSAEADAEIAAMFEESLNKPVPR
jgi:prevent-host-death family protein